MELNLNEKAKKEFNNWWHKEVSKSSYRESEYYTDMDYFTSDMIWGIYLRFIREKREVLIYVYRNGSGYLWSMEMADSGTGLGWSDFTGDCKLSSTFTSYDLAMKDAIELEMNFGDMPNLKSKSEYSHWGNYSNWLQDKRKNSKDE